MSSVVGTIHFGNPGAFVLAGATVVLLRAGLAGDLSDGLGLKEVRRVLCQPVTQLYMDTELALQGIHGLKTLIRFCIQPWNFSCESSFGFG